MHVSSYLGRRGDLSLIFCGLGFGLSPEPIVFSCFASAADDVCLFFAFELASALEPLAAFSLVSSCDECNSGIKLLAASAPVSGCSLRWTRFSLW